MDLVVVEVSPCLGEQGVLREHKRLSTFSPFSMHRDAAGLSDSAHRCSVLQGLVCLGLYLADQSESLWVALNGRPGSMKKR